MRSYQRLKLARAGGLGLLLLSVLIGSNGCARRYLVTLTNGNVYTAAGKPKYDKQAGSYSFKDTKGNVITVPGFRVKEIAPPGLEEKADFGQTPLNPPRKR
mgnify:CR=1 FL=1